MSELKKQYIQKLLKNENREKKFDRSKMLNHFNGKKFNKFYKKLNGVLNKYWENNNDESHFLNVLNNKHNNSRHLFVKSLTHKSYFVDREDCDYYYNYERNEFIGDSHLNYLIKRYVFNKYGKYGDEHLLSKISTFMISNKFYKLLFDDIGLYPLVYKSRETFVSPALKEDMLESFIHSFYCNFGIKFTKVFINKILNKYSLEWILEQSINFKTILNEEVFKKYKKPVHQVVDFVCKKNKKREFFCVGFKINGKFYKNTNKATNRNKNDLIEILCENVLKLI